MPSPGSDTGLVLGKYELVERLGIGGMAEVWKARVVGPRGFARTVVVKRVLPHLALDPEFVTMFVSEARLSARLTHSNIVQVFELGESGGEYFLAMEYVRGRDLIALLKLHWGQSPLPVGATAYMIREVCRALDYAHNLTDDEGRVLRLIHRDVSPSNVMVGFDGAVKLLDFGIAKALADVTERKTATGTLKGKFAYLAPEQVDGKPIDHRVDLFATGVMLHEMLANRRLFKGGSDLHTLAMVREANVQPPSFLNPEVPHELDRVCLRALARNPNDRFATCGEMARALDEVVHREKWAADRLAALMRELFPGSTLQSVPPLMPPVAIESPTSTLSQASIPAVTVSSKIRLGEHRRRSGRYLALGGGALALVLGVGAWWRLSSHAGMPMAAAPAGRAAEPTVASPSPRTIATPSASVAATAAPIAATATPSASAAATAAPIAATPPEVTFSIGSLPSGAHVFFNSEGTARGRTPLTVAVPRGDRKVRVRLELAGYTSVSTSVATTADAQVQLALLRESPKRPTALRPKRPFAPSSAPKPQGTVGGDDYVADPFRTR
jgi:serine/threonine-protein kinase